ncbi:hypothetical protein [Methylobacterium sp. 092160098-2]|uniref:hypothetical protein n=1 Tax=Methylobacterium sp. 092160098-2 TaxID=3025129 RepID=UPI002381C2E9|nr:hypothetical protein [Methylobacterium sp. 092160098-2]MDE4914790.1 hypothetical protein [Methylobacterium sp. 092160098-2]
MDGKDQRIAELEAALADKTRQWEGTKKIAVEQGYHKAARERAEAENALLRRALAALGGDHAVVQALRGEEARAQDEAIEGTESMAAAAEDGYGSSDRSPERDPAADAGEPAMRFG